MKWKPIKTAPKDQQIIISYRGGSGEPYSGQGRWVNWPSTLAAERFEAHGTPIPSCDEGHWEIAYIAVIEHSRGMPLTWETKNYRCEPTHWMPLPAPCAKT